MRFSTTPVVRLKGALRHSWKFSPKKKTVRLAVTGPSVKKGTSSHVAKNVARLHPRHLSDLFMRPAASKFPLEGLPVAVLYLEFLAYHGNCVLVSAHIQLSLCN
jgi:hypothetical protein